MMTIKIFTENQAFDGENYNSEVARILREIANKLESGLHPGNGLIANDINGNPVANVTTQGR
ncbi:MAG: hypothetical protein NUV80_06095 [Candidatus Berkelbacteria bacterium]|nr:hypothetical protein [Candidatus Berkelbacteria bacterium]